MHTAGGAHAGIARPGDATSGASRSSGGAVRAGRSRAAALIRPHHTLTRHAGRRRRRRLLEANGMHGPTVVRTAMVGAAVAASVAMVHPPPTPTRPPPRARRPATSARPAARTTASPPAPWQSARTGAPSTASSRARPGTCRSTWTSSTASGSRRTARTRRHRQASRQLTAPATSHGRPGPSGRPVHVQVARRRSRPYPYAWSCRTVARTVAPLAAACGSVYSAGEWERPSRLGTNSIAVGVNRAIVWLSCPAPEGMSIVL